MHHNKISSKRNFTELCVYSIFLKKRNKLIRNSLNVFLATTKASKSYMITFTKTEVVKQ